MQVYAIDLLGFGASEKPVLNYSIDLWAELVSDFASEIFDQPYVLVGNSIGSLVCLEAIRITSEKQAAPLPCGSVLINCAGVVNPCRIFGIVVAASYYSSIGGSFEAPVSIPPAYFASKHVVHGFRLNLRTLTRAIDACVGGMNNKARMDDWRIRLLSPVFFLIDVLLKTEIIAARLFNSFRTAENVREVLKSVYRNSNAVDDELVDIICKPADDPNALAVLVSVVTGPPGPRPEDLMEEQCIKDLPMLVLWGDSDVLTPVDVLPPPPATLCRD